MKIGIHKDENNSWSGRWISYCEEKCIAYKIVNAYENNIVEQLEDCDLFLWHYHHANYKDVLFAKELLYSLEIARKKVFPNNSTCWHFDDKVSQKYLLESINAPTIPTFVFYTKEEALFWINKTSFPKVFKLRGGAGSANVKLARTRKEARKFVKRAFGKGFSQFNSYLTFKDELRKYKAGMGSLRDMLRPIYYSMKLYPTDFCKYNGREKGYVYFQEFIANNDCDIRIIVVGKKAFAIKRMTRKGDFRASGSGNIIYRKEEIDERCVKLAFEINIKIRSQSIAYDFVFDQDNNPLIVEISYGFSASGYDNCEGYWDSDLNWHEGKFDPCVWMLEDLIKI